ncbi:MAG: N-acetylneuraminate synthase [Muribaculaceae bacterium]|nr:N-acetylneuraminate synthase [Muribaculaceae bacterium]
MTERVHTIIIAEAGVNHNGDLDTALALVRAAAGAGADYVKFQTFKAENLVAASAKKAAYQMRNCGDGDDSQLGMLRRLELAEADFAILRDECERCGIGFMSSPFDTDSVALLADIGQDYWKIPSGEVTNLPLLRAIGSRHGRIIMSTGMCTCSDIDDAIKVLEASGTPRHDVILLHCNTQYPTPMADVNLRAMDALRTFGCASVGYSDHTCGIEIPIAAVARGASVIEKHFTLDRDMPGPDHKASLEPDELAAMVSAIRNVELALGSAEKTVSPSEQPNVAVARKSIVASRYIKQGELLSELNMTVKRPGTGLSPMMWDSVVGTRALKDFTADELIVI